MLRMTKREADTYRKRLLTLAAYLRTVPKKQWDLSVLRVETEYGTVGCAIGHACDIPAFRRLGLSVNPVSVPIIYSPTHVVGTMLFGMNVAKELFGLTQTEIDYLFYPVNKGAPEIAPSAVLPATASPKRVAKHIEYFVNNWHPERPEHQYA